ncbi:uromodulin-like [Leptodactylus fuscus]|uniref:uromodulin-like n=1 Tax=Leptodactylus fuscus TaxID=238119 RepID=UPI003F4E74D9
MMLTPPYLTVGMILPPNFYSSSRMTIDLLAAALTSALLARSVSLGQNMKSLLWLSLLAFCIGAANSQNAKTCASCDATAGICSQKTGYVTCSCTSGYLGNGVTCTPLASCTTATCCSPGYYWDNRVGYKVCTDINECADATLNKCFPSSTCVNKAGIYLCSSNRNIACNNGTCAFDQDCLNVGSSVQCADPCSNYQLLDGTSRLSTINSTGVFTTDRYNFGWFRYNGTSGLKMQEGCVGAVKCGSAEPFTLNSSHPAIGEGIVMVNLIANTVSGCTAAGTLPVKACPGGYYVYKFTGSLKSEVYCTAMKHGMIILTKRISKSICGSNSASNYNSNYNYYSNYYNSNHYHPYYYNSNHYHPYYYNSNHYHPHYYNSNHYPPNYYNSNHYHPYYYNSNHYPPYYYNSNHYHPHYYNSYHYTPNYDQTNYHNTSYYTTTNYHTSSHYPNANYHSARTKYHCDQTEK